MRKPLLSLLLLTSCILTACGRAQLESTIRPDLFVLQYANPLAAEQNLPSLNIIPSDIELTPHKPFTIVIFEPGQNNNIELCRAIAENLNVASNFSPTPQFQSQLSEIVWFDRRSRKDFPHELQKSKCNRLLDEFDYERARSFATNFDLTGSQGPWLFSIDPDRNRAALLDFSGYNSIDYGEALLKWKLHLAKNIKFWAEPNSKNLATIFLIAFFIPEYLQNTLKIKN